MAQIGVSVTSQEVPPAIGSLFNTANGYMVGLADWGPVGSAGVTTPVISLGQAAAQVGPPNGGLIQSGRTATNATLYDSADVFFREGGSTLYISRVVGTNPTKGTLILQDVSLATAATLNATYYGTGSSAIYVVVANAGASYTVTLQDVNGNILAISPSLSDGNKADLIAWAATTSLVTATAGNTNLPQTIPAAPLSAGTDDRGTVNLASWAAALGGFDIGLGPGQVFAPGQSNTALAGIWATLADHAQENNRIALLDGADGNNATAAIAEVVTANISTGLQSYCGLWTGNLVIPGVISGTTRIIPPSPVIAALCARVDGRGNPNQAAAGSSYPLQYVSGVNTVYTGPLTGDIANLNNSGINVFSTQFNVLQNFGFVSLLGVPTSDAIYWQLNHGRTRMAIVNQAAIVAQPYEFSQVDGQSQTISSFTGALAGMLLAFYATGALYGATSTDAFTVDTGPSVNTPTQLSNGILAASLAVRMSPFAQLVQIVINAVPITQNLVQIAA